MGRLIELQVGINLPNIGALVGPEQGQSEIFNTDQSVQFSSVAFSDALESAGIRISMDGRGRALDIIFLERLRRSVNNENVCLWDYETVPALHQGL